jgi:hypothetical protein
MGDGLWFSGGSLLSNLEFGLVSKAMVQFKAS